MADKQFTEHARSNGSPSTDYMSGSPRSTQQSSIPHSLRDFTDDKPLNPANGSRPELMRRFRSKQRQRIMLIASLVLDDRMYRRTPKTARVARTPTMMYRMAFFLLDTEL